MAPDVASVQKLVLRNDVNGGQLFLSEIANISLQLEEEKTIGRFNSAPSVNLTVTKTARASTIDVAAAVREYARSSS